MTSTRSSHTDLSAAPLAPLLTTYPDRSSASCAKGGVQMFHGLSRWVVSQMRSLRNERGATAVEYGLMVALIAAVIVAIVATLGQQIQAAFTTVVNALP